MKTIYLTSIVILLAYSNNTAQDWEHYYGQDNVYNIAEDVQEAYDKGYLQLGRIYYEDNNEDWISQAWLIKTDVNGDVLWDKIFINTANVIRATAIEQTTDGGNLICGLFQMSNIVYPFIVKLNACGEKEWCRRIPGALNDLPWAEDVKELPNGDIVMLVNMYGVYPDETMHLFKFDANGSMLWQEAYCSGYEHDAKVALGEGIQIVSDNKIIISGSSYWRNPWEPQSEVYWIRPTYTMVDSNGNEEWVMPIGLQDTIVGDAYKVIEVSPNNFIGLTSDWRGDAEVNPMFVRFNSDGEVLDYRTIYAETINESFTEGSLGHFFLVDSLYYTSGEFEIGSNEYGPNTNVVIDTNLFLAEPNIVNHIIYDDKFWPHSFETTYNNKFINSATFKEPYNWDIYLTKLNKDLEQDSIYTGSYTYDSLCPDPILSGFITLYDCFMTDIGEIPTPKEYYAHIASIPLKIYPNPASNIINFALENTQFHSNIKLQIFDTSGKLIGEQPIAAGSEEATTDVSFWKNGMYAVVVLSGNKVVGRGKFVVR